MNVINGTTGNDTIDGTALDDTISGGDGDDTFVIESGDGSVLDFSGGTPLTIASRTLAQLSLGDFDFAGSNGVSGGVAFAGALYATGESTGPLVGFSSDGWGSDFEEGDKFDMTLTLSEASTERITVVVQGASYRAGDIDLGVQSHRVMESS